MILHSSSDVPHPVLRCQRRTGCGTSHSQHILSPQGLQACNNHPDLLKLSEEISEKERLIRDREERAQEIAKDRTGGNISDRGSIGRADSGPLGDPTRSPAATDGVPSANVSYRNLGASQTSQTYLGQSGRSGASGRDATPPPRDRPLSYRDVTPSHTPPTPIQVSRGILGQSASRWMGSAGFGRGAEQQNVDLERTGNFGRGSREEFTSTSVNSDM